MITFMIHVTINFLAQIIHYFLMIFLTWDKWSSASLAFKKRDGLSYKAVSRLSRTLVKHKNHWINFRFGSYLIYKSNSCLKITKKYVRIWNLIKRFEAIVYFSNAEGKLIILIVDRWIVMILFRRITSLEHCSYCIPLTVSLIFYICWINEIFENVQIPMALY